jgi:glycosyltransferase involved in cell wall biosynthesis
MDKKRVAICFANVPFIRGGAEICVESLHAELIKRDFEVDIVNIPFQWEPRVEIVKNMVLWRMINIDRVAGQPVDLVIATKFPSYMIKHPNKVTWLFHQHRAVYDLYGTGYSDFNRSSRQDTEVRDSIIKADNKCLRESRAIFTIAKNVSRRLKEYNGIDSKPLYHPPQHSEKFFCAGYGDYVLSVGRLESLKRVDLLVQAMQYTDKDVKCIIAGTGGQENYLKKMAVSLGLGKKIKFLGRVGDEDLVDLYARCFAVFFAPYDEDYGYVTLESFLSKKPLITCADSGGVMEFAEDRINAKVASLASPESVAAGINELYNNPTLCKKLGDSGYDRVKGIDWNAVIDQLTVTL